MLLGAPMAIGRAFLPEEEQTIGAAPVTVLSYGLWQRRFGGDPAIVGRTMTLNGRAFTVVGVTAEAFRGTNAIGGPQLWLPFAMYRETTSRLHARQLGFAPRVVVSDDGTSEARRDARAGAAPT